MEDDQKLWNLDCPNIYGTGWPQMPNRFFGQNLGEMVPPNSARFPAKYEVPIKRQSPYKYKVMLVGS